MRGVITGRDVREALGYDLEVLGGCVGLRASLSKKPSMFLAVMCG